MKTETQKNDHPLTPELDKMLEVKEKSQVIGQFLEWFQEGYVIAEYSSDGADLLHANINTEKLLAKYFKIDLKKIEKERSAILDWMRDKNSK